MMLQKTAIRFTAVIIVGLWLGTGKGLKENLIMTATIKKPPLFNRNGGENPSFICLYFTTQGTM